MGLDAACASGCFSAGPLACRQNSGCRGLTARRISKKARGLQGGGERGAGASGCAWSARPTGAGHTDSASLCNLEAGLSAHSPEVWLQQHEEEGCGGPRAALGLRSRWGLAPPRV